MPFDYLSRSADLKVNGFDVALTTPDIVKIVVEFFASENIKVIAVQPCPNKIARVTFENRQACEIVRDRSELDMGGVKVTVVPPPPPPPNWINVVVYNLPYDTPNEYINDALDFYGKIHQVRFQRWTNLPEVATGTRIVRMDVRHSIPRFVKIHTYRCKVWYRGQPISCDICKEPTHLAFNCPFKGKCLACGGGDHFSRKCPTVCFTCKGGHASDSCPNRRRWEHTVRDADDLQSVTSEVGAGAPDVVAQSAVDPASGSEDPATNTLVADLTAAAVSALAESQPSQLPVSLDDSRFNQLDELQSQDPASSAQSQDDGTPQSQSVLAGLSDVVNDACEAIFRVPAVPASPGTPLSDSAMADPSAARKRDLSSDSSSHRSRSRNRKSSRVPGQHMPSGVTAAATLARSRSSSSSRSSSAVRPDSKS